MSNAIVTEAAWQFAAVPLFQQFVPAITALPAATRWQRADLQIPELLLHQAGRLAIYYAPFDYLQPTARVVLVGIAPGFQQMAVALRATQAALLAGESDYPALLTRVKYQASFAGPIRRYLVWMLDQIGLQTALDLATSALLYDERSDLLQTSAVVRHPVFVGGKDWTGHAPLVRREPLLSRYLWERLLPELTALPDALVIALGACAAAGLRTLIAADALDPARCLLGLPHPSGANAHRFRQFAAVQDEATAQVAAWFASRG